MGDDAGELEVLADAASADVEREQVVEHAIAQLELPKLRDGDAKWEMGEIPADVRAEVLARDGGSCRFCGTYVEHPALHHIRYRSEGGKNHPDNLISLHWMFAPRCHERMHGRKKLWQPIGLQVVNTPGLTMLQLERWQRTRRQR